MQIDYVMERAKLVQNMIEFADEEGLDKKIALVQSNSST